MLRVGAGYAGRFKKQMPEFFTFGFLIDVGTVKSSYVVLSSLIFQIINATKLWCPKKLHKKEINKRSSRSSEPTHKNAATAFTGPIERPLNHKSVNGKESLKNITVMQESIAYWEKCLKCWQPYWKELI